MKIKNNTKYHLDIEYVVCIPKVCMKDKRLMKIARYVLDNLELFIMRKGVVYGYII